VIGANQRFVSLDFTGSESQNGYRGGKVKAEPAGLNEQERAKRAHFLLETIRSMFIYEDGPNRRRDCDRHDATLVAVQG